ncbi:MAG: type I-U CRISPR-associated protein Cas7 [Bryobacterales bacterium]|nr:type I-U CRISPR-associated protein Cas7 [Bryobacterales bacterium]
MCLNITLGELCQLVEGGAVAIRGRAVLEPAGGPGDKVFPPSHSVGDSEKRPGAKYAFETRRRDGKDIRCVLIDSVQSQANRMEEALQALWDDRRLTLPVIEVDLSRAAPDVHRVTSLTAPHRVADALLRDSFVVENGEQRLFRLSTPGRSFTDASPRNAGPLFRVCPTGLVFGVWDSTGPKGGLGAKFARVLTSEIIGIGAEPGVKTASRIDPAQIVNAAATIYRKRPESGEIPTWTLDPEEAELNRGDEPLKWGAKKKNDGTWKQGEGKPTTANHSNIPPTIDDIAGGVTIDRAEHTVVLSLAGLRRLGFTEDGATPRVVLAALGLVAILAAESRGHDLRSRCLLIPRWDAKEEKSGALVLEAVAQDGSTTPLTLDLERAVSLYEEAVRALPDSLRFADNLRREPLATLTPSPKLEQLITQSRVVSAAGADVEEE